MSRVERRTEITLATSNKVTGGLNIPTGKNLFDTVIIVLIEVMLILCISSVYIKVQLSLLATQGEQNQINQLNASKAINNEIENETENEKFTWDQEIFTTVLDAFFIEAPKTEKEEPKKGEESTKIESDTKSNKNTQVSETEDTKDVKENKREERNAYTIKGMKSIYQLPELPTGCEATALTILLNYYGIKAEKWQIAMKYMPREDLYYKNGDTYGPSPEYVFVGDPSKNSGLGCFATCLVKTYQNYVKDHEEISSEYKAVNLTGKEFSDLLQDYVVNDNPVVVIVSQNLSRPYGAGGWKLIKGGTWNWMANHHAMVVYGFDKPKNKVLVCDPLRADGFYEYSLSEFVEIYNAKGKSAMTVMTVK